MKRILILSMLVLGLAGSGRLGATSQPFLGEIQLTSFDFAPRGWAFCNGQLLPINQNQGLFSLLGTTYGGNGQTTFALPNLQGRVMIGEGNNYVLGQTGGEEHHTLNQQEMPMHSHGFANRAGGNFAIPMVAARGTTTVASATVGFATMVDSRGNTIKAYNKTGGAQILGGTNNFTGVVGGNQPHNNMPPYLTLRYIIAIQGIFPSQ